ncbi:hypothetical protein GCM10027521_66790 [Amycolatopsis cihanbeyliensis]
MVEVPELTARVARASNPGGTTAMWVRDRLGGLWGDEDFADCYSRDGRPGLSPAQSATVSVSQFLLGLSDRDAAEAVRCRIDFKYALGLESDDPGFHHSVLGDFRDRLLRAGRADRLLDVALARLKEAGLVRKRTTQRADSTHVLAAVRDLTRLELVTEAVARGPGGTRPHRRPRARRPGRRALGPPLRPTGAFGQEPNSAQDQDQHHRGGRPSPARTSEPSSPRPAGRAPGADPAAGAGAELSLGCHGPPAVARRRVQRPAALGEADRLALRFGDPLRTSGGGHPLAGVPRARDRDLLR